MPRIKKDELKKARSMKLTDKVWNDFLNLKSRDDKSWDLFLTELIDLFKRIRNL